MNLIISKLVNGKALINKFEGKVDQSLLINTNPLIDIKNINVVITVMLIDDIITLTFKGNVNVILECSYTLSHFAKNIFVDDQFEISLDKDNDDLEYIQLGKTNEINLDEFLLASIRSSIPMVVIKPGVKLPKGNSDYRVLTEEELAKEKENSYDPRFDKLKDIDI